MVAAARAADDKKGSDTIVLEVGEVLAITGWFVITSGSNPRQVKTIADEVEARVRAAGGPPPLRVEGLADLHWVLLDFGDFVVHVFLDETRRYYELERLWADVPRLPWADAGEEPPPRRDAPARSRNRPPRADHAH
ncbi:MAG: ribosome silencing factor [Acidimicrobiales bacterium]|nr:ribosome silencing factor [Acidimicrobiales bacterium]